MEGARLSGLGSQVSAFEQLLSLLNIALLPLPRNLSEMGFALQKFKGFVLELKMIQNSLAKPFPFIAEVEVPAADTPSPPPPPRDSSPSPEPFALFGGRMAFSSLSVSKLTETLSTVGKSVRKFAETGYSRLGALPAKATLEELTYLSSLVTSLCERCVGLEGWIDFLESERVAGAATLPEEQRSAWTSCVENILFELAFVSAFFTSVVSELLLRDLELLTARYMKKMRQSLASASEDEDDDDARSTRGTDN